jgi:hypothetical protein
LSTVYVASPASVATSADAAYWNDRPVAKVWFNSGTHRPDLGTNSFALKVEEGASEAAVFWEKPAVPEDGQWRTIYGSNNEITFSVSGPVDPDAQIWYQVCGKIDGKSYCGRGQFDWIR